jgi:hypothetical protein
MAHGMQNILKNNIKESSMAQCDTCGNDYENNFEVTLLGHSYTFDSIECAAHKIAPVCENCDCRILGHGIQAGDQIFCSSHCARVSGVEGVQTHVGHYAQHPLP